MRQATRKQLSNLKVRKDPKKRAKPTKVHDDKHEYKRNAAILCEECGNDAMFCECLHNWR